MHVQRRRSASVLLEFAFIALILYFLLAAILDFGRALYIAQAIQQAADSAARELSRTPLPPQVGFPFRDDVYATLTPTQQARVDQIYSKNFLVVDLGANPVPADFFADKPLLNQQLWPVMIVDLQLEPGRRFLRYPGRVIVDSSTPTGYSVDVPILEADGITYTPRPVVEEVIPITATEGPHSLTTGAPGNQRGYVNLRINYPFQAATISAHETNPAGPFEPNIGPDRVIDAEAGTQVGPYTSEGNGLGRQFAVGKEVRPFRKVITGQAIYRREVFD